MDVRHYAFLARPASAEVKSPEHFLGMPKRGLAFLLANVMFWQPIWAQADGIVVATPGTSLGQAGNGVPIVNIATPNGSGLSHNQFHDYNVGSQGVILNNVAAQTGATQLGGIIIGNPNLTSGVAAQTILNEVVSGSPSQLRGYTEVAGQSARVIVANPYGISCSGCGFINTPRVTLTTGKPVLDGGGRLDRFQVDQGSVSIEGAGLNATNVDRFEIITRSAKINAEIQAKNLTIVAGRNDVNADSLNATARANDGSAKPQLAIDSSALGGMYAGAIKLVGTEAGVGVKLAGNVASSGGDIQIDANGHLSMVQASAHGAVNVKAASLDAQGPVYAGTAVNVQTQGNLTNQQSIAARDSITLSAGGVLTNSGLIEAGVNTDGSRNASGDVSLAAQSLSNAGKSAVASRNLTVNTAQTLNNQNGNLGAGQTVKITGGMLDNRTGRVLGDLGLSIDLSDVLDNRDGLLGSGTNAAINVASLDNQQGTVVADGQLLLTASTLDNREGDISANAGATVLGNALNNQKGKLITIGALKLTADTVDNRQNGLLGSSKAMTLIVDDIDNRGGEISAYTDLSINGTKLDNSDEGRIFSGQALSVTTDQVLNRNKGLLNAATALNLQGRLLDNSGGRLLSVQDMHLELTGAFDNSLAQVSSEGTLTVSTTQLVNTLGSLSSAAGLTLSIDGGVSNRGGALVSEGGLALTSASLDNREHGSISGKGATTVTTGAFDNSQGGRLTSASTLNLTAGQVTNQDDGRIGSLGALTASVTGLDQQGGKLSSNSSLSLDLNNGRLNNQSGLINAPGALLLKQLQAVNNQSGEISSTQAFTLKAQSLDNSNGKLLSNQGLTLRIADALDNVKGLIGAATLDARAASLNNGGGSLTSRGDLQLTVDGLLRNDAKGQISAAQLLEIDGAEFNNQSGRLLGGAAVFLNAMALNNGEGGLINSQGNLILTATQLDSSNDGEVSAKGDIDLTLTSLTQNGGRLLGEKAVTLDLTGGDFDNRNGLLTAKGPLTFKHLRDLDNQRGEISSSLGFDVAGRVLDNGGGQLISRQLLTVNGTRLLNQKGLISGWQGLTVYADSLDNRDSGTLSSRNGDVTVSLTGALLNSDAGALVSQGNLSVNAQSLNNSGKGILSSAAGQTLTLGESLNNTQGGLIDSGAELHIVAGAVTNASGAINAKSVFTAQANSLDNTAGSIAGNDSMTLNVLGALTNTRGKLAGAGPVLIKGVTDLANQNGQLGSQSTFTLLTGSLDNSNNGTIAAKDALQITASGAVRNDANGLIYSQTAGLNLQAASLANGKGAIQGQGLTLGTLAGLDNNGGRISAQAWDANVTAAGFDNRNGVLYAKGLASVTGGSLENSNGQIAGDRIDLNLNGILNNRAGIVESSTRLAVTAASLDNQTGQLRSLGNSGKTEFQIGGLLDNRNGVLQTANTNLTLAVGSFLNAGGQLNHVGRGTFDMSTANVMGAGGSITTGGLLELNAGSWTNTGVIQAARLNVNVNTFSQTASGQLLASNYLQARGGNWNNDGLIASDGVIDMQLGGVYGGNGRVSSVGGLNLSAAQLNLNAASSIAGGSDTTLRVGGQLSNAGYLTSDAGLSVEAGSIVNSGTLGAAENLELKTPSLLNDRGLVFSGGDMKFGVASLTNQNGDIYGLGNIVMGGYGATRAASIRNISATMESGAAFTANADVFENRTSGTAASGTRKLISGLIANVCGDCIGGVYTIMLKARELYETTDSDSSASAALTAGKDFVFQGGSFLNSKSTVAAGGDITINADSFQNIGATSGMIERTVTYMGDLGAGYTAEFLASVVTPYNQRNNPEFPYVFYIDKSMEIRKAVPKSGHAREGGREGETFDVVSLSDSETGDTVGGLRGYSIALPGLSYGFETSTLSQYDPNNLVALPTQLNQLGLISDVEVARDNTGAIGTTTTRNAVIQAGGNVSITAAKDLQNSVIHEDYGTMGGVNKVGDTRSTGAGTTVIRLNAQLPPDLAQQQVNPLSLPGFALPTGQNGLFRLSSQGTSDLAPVAGTAPVPGWSVSGANVDSLDHVAVGSSSGPRSLLVTASAGSANGAPGASNNSLVTRVTGLPQTRPAANAHKYLIETNPVLTDLKQFMSSDYLLANLGYDPDLNIKRLGDGLYEQRLIQQAVVARTGQRYIDGQTTDEGLFKYLMNNAIASKEELDLSVGVTLTSQQVAALTHDIVWLEEHEVNGEKVLVPVLYLAQAEGRLGPTGALIAGRDVTLIAGQNLDNVGTLKSTQNLSATAGNTLVNSGLIQAGNRLDVLAGNDVINQAGGILAGRDVSVTAIRGDVLNERTIISQDISSERFGTQHHDFADSAARIEAANDLSISAGRDINIIGGDLHSGRDINLDAGRDLNVAAAQVSNSVVHDAKHTSSDITQLSASLRAGRDLSAQTGRDLNVIASNIDAKRDIAMAAGENLTISSAADEEHSLSKSKKLTRQEDHVRQVMSGVTAGGDVALSAGQNLALISSRIAAGDEAYLVAGDRLDILAAQDTDYSLYDKKKKGSFGSLKTQHDEVTNNTHIGSEIKTGGDLTLSSGGDQHYQVAKLDSGKDIVIDSGGSILFEGVKDLHDETHTKSDNDAFWTSSKGKGNTDETLRQSQMIAKGNIVIKAVDGLKIDIKQINQETVTQSIDAMVKADPQLAWLKEAEARGDVDWRQVKEIHESFKYSNSGLGPASQLIIAIALAAIMGPMMAGMNAMMQAAAISVATKATVSTIDNRGNLGAVLKDVTSKDSLNGYAVSVATAGVTQGLNYNAGTVGFNTESLKVVAMKVAADAVIKTAVYGGSFKDNLATSLASTVASIGGAYGARKIGDLSLAAGSLEKILLHSALGGLMAEVMGGDFRTGAIAGGANEALIGLLGDKLLPSNLTPGTAEYIQAEANLLALSKIVGVLGAAASNGDIDVAAHVAENGTQYNFLGNHSQAERDRALKEYEENKSLDAAKKMLALQGADQRSDGLLDRFQTDPASLSVAEKTELAAYLQVYGYEQSLKYGDEYARSSIENLLNNGPIPYRDYPYAGGTYQERVAYADALRAADGVSVGNIFWSRDQSSGEMLYRDAQGYLRINGEMQAMGDVGTPALYFLTGPLGTTIRTAAAANGVLQTGYGAGQVYNGDTWNGIGNILVGALNAASLGIPKIKPSGATGGVAETGEGGYFGGGSLGEKGSVFSGKNIDDLSNAGKLLDPADKSGQLSLAGRALQKHGSRQGSAFPSVKGSPSEINAQGQKIADEILSNPATTVIYKDTGRFGKVMDVIAPDGRGLRYNSNGKFIGLLEPPKQ